MVCSAFFKFNCQQLFPGIFYSKVSFVHYGNISTSYTTDELQFYWLDKIKNKTVNYVEPGFNTQFVVYRLQIGLKQRVDLLFHPILFIKIRRFKPGALMLQLG
jgi:hypothetical protein